MNIVLASLRESQCNLLMLDLHSREVSCFVSVLSIFFFWDMFFQLQDLSLSWYNHFSCRFIILIILNKFLIWQFRQFLYLRLLSQDVQLCWYYHIYGWEGVNSHFLRHPILGLFWFQGPLQAVCLCQVLYIGELLTSFMNFFSQYFCKHLIDHFQ